MSELLTLIQRQQNFAVPQGNWRRITMSLEAELAPAITLVLGEIERAHFSERDIFAVRMLLEEGLVNALKHGNRYDPTKRIELRYSLQNGWFMAEIEDQGEGFNLGAVPDPCAAENIATPSGRGLLLMRAYSSWLAYNEAGNCVSFARHCERKLQRTTISRAAPKAVAVPVAQCHPQGLAV